MTGLPDLAWIKRSVNVADVGRKLELDMVADSTARCWRTENHKNGDRTPSLSFDKRSNRAQCFVCDQSTFSNVDLVMKVLGCTVREAAMWIQERFPDVPTIPKGKHVTHRNRSTEVTRAGTEDADAMLVRSGFLATITPAEQAVLRIIQEFADRATREITISYLAIMRYSGLKHPATIAKAIQHFQRIGLICIQHKSAEAFGVRRTVTRAVNRYTWTPDSTSFQKLLREISQRHKADAESERQIRNEVNTLQRQRRAHTQVKYSLHSVNRGQISRFTECSVNFNAVDAETIKIPVKGSSDSNLPQTFLMKKGTA